MKNQYKIYSIILIILMTFSFAKAQNTIPYVESISSENFVSIGSTGTRIIDINNNSENYHLNLSNFHFDFDNQTYNDFYISPKGWISFGSNLGEEINNNNNNDLRNLSAPIVVPLWDEFNIDENNNLRVSYLLEEDNGERVLIIEWEGIEWMSYAASFEPGSTISFQVKLYQNSKNIEFYYQSESNIEFNYDPTAGEEISLAGASIGFSYPNYTPMGYGLTLYGANTVPLNTLNDLHGKKIEFIPSQISDTISISKIQFPTTTYPSSSDVKILKVLFNVPIDYSDGKIVNQLKFNISGSSNKYDIKNIKLYQSNATNELVTLIETKSNVQSDIVVFNGLNFELVEGENVFWMVFDVDENAIEGNVLDAELMTYELNNIVKPLMANTTGAVLILNNISYSGRGISPSQVPIDGDYLRNWNEQIIYNEDGTIKSHQRSYFDGFGRTTQKQSLVEGATLISEVLYDMYGRAAIQTLPALGSSNTNIIYDENFIENNSEVKYSYLDFDLSTKKYNTNAISTNSTLGYYYSNSNSIEPYTPASAFPYNRIEYTSDAYSNVKTQTFAGEAFKLGSNKQMKNYAMLSSGELAYVYGIYRSYIKDLTRSGNVNSTSEFSSAYKKISINDKGETSISFIGPNSMLIASCLSGTTNSSCIAQKVGGTIVIHPIDKYKYTNSVDIHLPKNKSNTLKFSLVDNLHLIFSNFNIDIFDLNKQKKLVKDLDYSLVVDGSKYKLTFLTGNAINYNLQDNFLRISVNIGTHNKNFNLFKSNVNLDFVMNFEYELDYSNWTVNYYDFKGNLINTMQPKDMDCNYNPISNLNVFNGNNIIKINAVQNQKTFDIEIPSVLSNDRQLTYGVKAYVDYTLSTSNYYWRSTAKAVNNINNAIRQELGFKLAYNEAPDIGTPSTECLAEIRPLNFYNTYFKLEFDIYGVNASNVDVLLNPIDNPLIIDLNFIGYTVDGCNAPKFKILQGNSKLYNLDNGQLQDFTEIKFVTKSIKFGPQLISLDPNNSDHITIIDPFTNNWNLLDLLKLKFNYDLYTYPYTSVVNNSNDYSKIYDLKNRLVSDFSKEEGNTKFVYDNEGKLRFSQNAIQRLSNKFSYINYDALGRVLETGIYDPAIIDENASLYYFFETADQYTGATFIDRISVVGAVNNTGPFNPVRCINRQFMAYDASLADVPISISSTYKQMNLHGRLVKSWGEENTTWYSYDYKGRATWVVQGQNELGIKTIDYTYTYWDQIDTMIYQKGQNNEKLTHMYTYDNYGRMIQVNSLKGTESVAKLHARYYYYKHGPLKRKELGDKIQGVDYVYTINGWLKSINEPSLTSNRDPGKDSHTGANSLFGKDVFGMSLDYYDNDYVKNNTYIQNQLVTETNSVSQYDGKIKAMNWQTELPTGANQNSFDISTYVYQYDRQGQLTSAIYGHTTLPAIVPNTSTLYVNGSMDELPEYKVSEITYDLNGNITGMDRHGLHNGVDYMMDKLRYSYLSGTNKLATVKDEHVSEAFEEEIQYNISNAQRYFYDEMGRLVTDQIKNITIKYNHFNKVSEIYDATTQILKIKYAYNERGQKIRKTVYADPNNENFVIITHYLNDLSGNVMAVYTDTRLDIEPPNVQLAEITLYGVGRLGLVYNSTESISPYVYELTDHVGNVRATVLAAKVLGAVEVLSYTDYYPHGSVMPGRHYESSSGYRYDFQGQEKDLELNWNNFELRMYDPNLARWMSPDPYREFHSPYLAMGNDPINRIDPSGGKSSRVGDGANAPDIDYTGRARPEDPFDMVGGGGFREESYGWYEGKLISLEDDPYSPYTLEEQISGRIDGVSNGTGNSNSNPNENLIASNDPNADRTLLQNNQQDLLIKNFQGVEGLTLLKFNVYGNDKYGGVKIELLYESQEVDENTNWVQRIYTDYPLDEKTSPYFDSRDGNRFYLLPNELKKYRSNNSILFVDGPRRNFSSDGVTWRAVLSLYNSNNNRLFSIYYGFDLKNNSVIPYPPEVRYYYKK